MTQNKQNEKPARGSVRHDNVFLGADGVWYDLETRKPAYAPEAPAAPKDDVYASILLAAIREEGRQSRIANGWADDEDWDIEERNEQADREDDDASHAAWKAENRE